MEWKPLQAARLRDPLREAVLHPLMGNHRMEYIVVEQILQKIKCIKTQTRLKWSRGKLPERIQGDVASRCVGKDYQ